MMTLKVGPLVRTKSHLTYFESGSVAMLHERHMKLCRATRRNSANLRDNGSNLYYQALPGGKRSRARGGNRNKATAS